jgi:hypothetical protein
LFTVAKVLRFTLVTVLESEWVTQQKKSDHAILISDPENPPIPRNWGTTNGATNDLKRTNGLANMMMYALTLYG